MNKNNLRICFLDIDGVLNSTSSFVALGRSTYYEDENGNTVGTNFNPVSLKLLEKLCKKFDLKIYVHSTWSKWCDYKWFQKHIDIDVEFLETFGYEEKREQRIETGIRNYKPDDFIILDDYDLTRFFREQAIVVDNLNGLDYNSYQKVCEYFGEKTKLVLF